MSILLNQGEKQLFLGWNICLLEIDIIKNGSLSKDKRIYVSKGQDRVRRYLEENYKVGGEEGLIERQRVDHWAEEQGIRVPYWIKPEELNIALY